VVFVLFSVVLGHGALALAQGLCALSCVVGAHFMKSKKLANLYLRPYQHSGASISEMYLPNQKEEAPFNQNLLSTLRLTAQEHQAASQSLGFNGRALAMFEEWLLLQNMVSVGVRKKVFLLIHLDMHALCLYCSVWPCRVYEQEMTYHGDPLHIGEQDQGGGAAPQPLQTTGVTVTPSPVPSPHDANDNPILLPAECPRAVVVSRLWSGAVVGGMLKIQYTPIDTASDHLLPGDNRSMACPLPAQR